MKKVSWSRIGFVIALAVILVTPDVALSSASSQTNNGPARGETKDEKGATMHATGSFDVKVIPSEDKPADPQLGRMSLDKHYHGDLEASAIGQMLTGGDFKTGSAGYVAMEKVTGTLKGHTGTFLLQHNGTLNQGAQQLAITIVPGSGTGQLAGVAGKMEIKIAEGKHTYDLEYSLPEAR